MTSRASKLPKYVYVQHIKGKTYYRFRRKGGGAVRIPGRPGAAEFHAAYARLLATVDRDIGRLSPGSVAHSIDLYEKSAEFTQLAGGTQRDYRRYLTRLERASGGRSLSSLTPAYVLGARDKLRETPSAANHMIAVVRTLFQFAKARGIIPADPTDGIQKLKGGAGYQRWTDEDVEQFRVSADPMMALALDMGLYTGQRLSDVIRLTWASYDGARFRLKQQKTGTAMSIPVHHALRAILAATPHTGETILTTKTGLAFHPRVFSRDFQKARIDAELPKGLSFHGLRHTAASRLAELGAGAPEIQAITGHKSLKLVEHYIRQASQSVQADRAIDRMGGQSAKPAAKLDDKPLIPLGDRLTVGQTPTQ